MKKNPNPEDLEVCMDGIGADMGDIPTIPPSIPQDIASRKYTVRYIIPTVSSNDARDTKGSPRNMSVSAKSAEDAVKTVLAAHPNADISSVD